MYYQAYVFLDRVKRQRKSSYSRIGFITFLFVCGVMTACNKQQIESKETIPSIIPVPQQINMRPGVFNISNTLSISYPEAEPEAAKVIEYFVSLVQQTTNIDIAAMTYSNSTQDRSDIEFRLAPHAKLTNKEAYIIDVTPERITVVAATSNGLFYGAVTLWQVLTSEIKTDKTTGIPALYIKDAPRFPWRGLLLDSARHYQSPEFIKQFIDWMALHKLNILHWHLTDDQGWRLEIKKYPRLTEVGGFRVPAGAGPQTDIDIRTGKPRLYGGYYSQEVVRDIVSYAKDRFITIVPEIDMPGHMQAAIVAYPELGVVPAPEKVSNDWGIHTYLYNVEEQTFSFIEDVLREVMELFPGEYIHVGGDEAVKDQWQASPRIQQRMQELGINNEAELQSYFIKRIDRFLNANGRRLIGWDEILEGGLAPDASVMSWRGLDGAVEAARAGHDVVMTPVSTLYFDHVQSSSKYEPPGRPGVYSLKAIYDFEPVPGVLNKEEVQHVLGAQANIWTEHIRTPERVTHAAFPRAAALAEITWSPVEQRNWDNFLDRLVPQFVRYEKLDLNFARSAFEVQFDVSYNKNENNYQLSLANQVNYGTIHYTLDGSEPDLTPQAYEHGLVLSSGTTLRAATFKNNYRLSTVTDYVIDPVVYARREDEELALCSDGIVLRLEDDDPVAGDRPVFLVDILNPCWIYEQADLSSHSEIEINIGQLPYNFQLWKDSEKIIKRPPATAEGELEIRMDSCESEVIVSLPLAQFVTSDLGLTKLTSPITQSGVRDLCFVFTGADHEPLHVIDSIQLISK